MPSELPLTPLESSEHVFETTTRTVIGPSKLAYVYHRSTVLQLILSWFTENNTRNDNSTITTTITTTTTTTTKTESFTFTKIRKSETPHVLHLESFVAEPLISSTESETLGTPSSTALNLAENTVPKQKNSNRLPLSRQSMLATRNQLT